MGNEVLEFAEAIGAKDLRSALAFSEFHSLFRRRNYFLLGKIDQGCADLKRACELEPEKCDSLKKRKKSGNAHSSDFP